MRIPLTRYGYAQLWAYGSALTLAAVLSGFYFPYVTPLFVIVLAWLFSFFRDPERRVPEGAALLVAPADGRITDIDEREEDLLGGKVRRVSIFLSIFDVHINRSPCSGRVVSTEYRPGKFLSATNRESARVNESNDVLIESDEVAGARVLVRQIAGVIARRIVCECEPPSALARGERFGMIKFGSRTDLFVPVEHLARLDVETGQTVRAGSTVIGALR